MPDPIVLGGASRDFGRNNPPEESELHDRNVKSLDSEIYGVCRNPDTVLGGALCGDDTAVSNACRRSQPGSVDAWVCDDKNLERVESKFWGIAKDAAWKAIQLFFGGGPSKP